MRRRVRSSFASLLAVSLLASPVAAQQADDSDEAQRSTASEAEGGSAADPREIVELRTQRSKTFAIEGDAAAGAGSRFETRWFSEPVHYESAPDEWLEVDTTLVKRGGRYQVSANGFGLSIAEDARDAELLRLQDAEAVVSFGLHRPGDVAAVREPGRGDTLLFRRVWPEADLRLISVPSGVKEEIVLHRPPQDPVFAFPMSLAGVTPRLSAAGSVEFVDAAGVTRFVVPAPWMADSNFDNDPLVGESSNAAEYRVVGEPGDEVLELHLDEGWLKAPERVYPVVVDPTVVHTTTPYPYIDTYYAADGVDYRSYTTLHTGRSGDSKERAYLQLGSGSTAGSLTGGDGVHTVTSSALYVSNYLADYCPDADGNGVGEGHEVYAKRVTDHWDYHPEDWVGTYGPNYDGASGSYTLRCDPDPSSSNSVRISIDVTSIARDWEYGVHPNYGLALVASFNRTDSRRFFYSEQYTGSGGSSPTLYVQWENTTPDVPIQVAPSAGSVLPEGTVTLSGTYGDADGDWGYVHYYLQRYSAGSWSDVTGVSPKVSRLNEPCGCEVPVDVSLSSGLYRWRAQNIDGPGDRSAYSTWVEFEVNGPPDVPVQKSPTDGTSTRDVDALTAGFSDPQGDAGTVAFRVERDSSGTWMRVDDGSWVSPQVASGQDATYTLASDLDPGAYRWQATATDEHGATAGPSGWWDFTIEHPPLDAPIDVRSTTHTVGEISVSSSITMEWTAPADTRVDGYSYAFTQSGTASLDATIDTTGTTASSVPLSEGSWWFHIASIDTTDGLQSPAESAGPFHIKSAASLLGYDGHAGWMGGVNATLSNYVRSDTDAQVATVGSPLEIVRTYNSRDLHVGSFGAGWSFAYDLSATERADGDVDVRFADGHVETFNLETDGSYTPPAGYYTTLTGSSSSGWTATSRDDTAWSFGPSGTLTSVTDRNRNTVTLRYDAAGDLDAITDVASGRALDVTTVDGRITRIATDAVASHGGPLVWDYTYTGNLLTKACSARTDLATRPCTEYAYNEGAMTHVTLPKANFEATIDYRIDGSVASVSNGTGDTTSYSKAASVKVDGNDWTKVEVTDPRGFVTRMIYDDQFRLRRELQPDDATKQPDPARTTAYGYSGGNRTQITDPNGNVSTLGYDERGNVTSIAVTDATTGVVTTTYNAYDAADNLIGVRDPRSSGPSDNTYLTSYGYDGAGNRTSQTTPATAQFPSGTTRTWVYTDGSEGAVDGGTMPAGLLERETDARGNSVVYAYDAKGDLRRTTDRSGLVVDYGYDEIGRRISSTEISQAFPSGVATNWTYNGDSQPTTETHPQVTNPVSGATHQLRITRSFDGNGNLTAETHADLTGGDPSRQWLYGYDNADRENQVTDPESHQLSRTFDAAGNVATVTDQLGRVTATSYDARNLPTTVTLRGFTTPADPGAAARDIQLSATSYDDAGRKLTVTDAEGRTRRWSYDAYDRVLTVVLEAFEELDGSLWNIVLQKHTYGPAGHLLRTEVGDGTDNHRVVTFGVDQAGLTTSRTVDPGGLARTTTYRHDANGNVVREELTDPSGRVETTEYDHDAGDRVRRQIVHNDGGQLLTTASVYDDRGLLVSRIDPRGVASPATGDDQLDEAFTTRHTYDQSRRRTTTTWPQVDVIDGLDAAANPTPARPVATAGYSTFGDPSHATDVRGFTTVTAYDRLGRETTITHPTDDGSTPTERFAYDAVGNIEQRTSRRGQVTDYAFDDLNRLAVQIDPLVAGQPGRGTVSHRYDDVGNEIETVDQVGARTTATYDDLDRLRTRTVHVRDVNDPAQVTAHVWTYDHDDLGNETLERQPEPTAGAPRPQTTTVFNAESEPETTTDPAGQVWTSSYDLAGRLDVRTDPTGVGVNHDYDLAGRLVASRQVPSDGSTELTTAFGHDQAGNVTAETSPRGFVTTRAYDAQNRLVSVTTPVDATADITVDYGYDAAGNPTRLTDGRGNTTASSYQAWGLLDTVREPDTAVHHGSADSDWVTSYDPGGLPTGEQRPGGVTVTRTFDALGRLTVEDAAGTTAPAASRTFAYDLASRTVGVGHPEGDVAWTLDDRGLPVEQTGGAGTASWSYDGIGRPQARTDATGTSSFAWTERSQLQTTTDPLTGQTATNGYDRAGRLTSHTVAGSVERTLTYDGHGRLGTDTTRDGAATLTIERTYGYDDDSNPTSQTIDFANANTAEGAHGYGYDRAGRLTRWDKPDGTTVTYGWDGSHNRTSVDPDGSGTTPAQNATYDERNRLTFGPAGSYLYTARGTMTEAGATVYVVDALDRTVTAGGTDMAYDSLDRVATRRGGLDVFTYNADQADPTAISNATGTLGSWFARDPAGELTAISQQTVDGSSISRAATNRHGDLDALLATDGSLTASRVYSPYGQVETEQATVGQLWPELGFQSDYTDPVTGDVWMGARWYQPAAGVFTARDTIRGELATPISLNRHTYAAGSPLTYFDPTGRFYERNDQAEFYDQRHPDAASSTREYRRRLTNEATAGTDDVYRRVRQAQDASARLARARAAHVVMNVLDSAFTRAAGRHDHLLEQTASCRAVGVPMAYRECRVEPLTQEQALFLAHVALDFVGFIPAVGEPADLLNAVLYGIEGSYGDAAISIVAIIPFAGDFLKPLRYTDEVAGALQASRHAPRGLPAGDEAFHYTQRQFVESIQEHGLRSGSYATPSGNLSPLQAHIELSLPPNTPLRDAVLRVDVAGLRRAGYEIPGVTRVSNVVRGPGGRVYTMPGGGYELNFPYAIPPEFIKVVR